MSREPEVLDRLPGTDDGGLSEFMVDVGGQRIVLIAQCPLAGYETEMNIRAEFEGLVYLAFTNRHPIRLWDENGIDRFEELPVSEIPTFVEDRSGLQEARANSPKNLLALDDRNGWQWVVTDFGTATVGSKDKRVTLRYFVVDSTWLSAKWLCQSARFELTPGPPITWGKSQ